MIELALYALGGAVLFKIAFELRPLRDWYRGHKAFKRHEEEGL